MTNTSNLPTNVPGFPAPAPTAPAAPSPAAPPPLQLGQPNTANTTSFNPTANTLYIQEIVAAATATLTGVILRGNGGTNIIVSLYNSQGQLIAQSPSTAQAAGFNQIPFSAPVTVPPGVYYLGVQYSTASENQNGFNYIVAPTGLIAQGSFAAPSSIAGSLPLTPQQANTIPIMSTY